MTQVYSTVSSEKLTIEDILEEQSMNSRGQIKDVKKIKEFVLGGNATFTLVSKRTGDRFTFRVAKPSERTPHFVSLLTGSDNEHDYQYLATIFDGRNLRRTKKSRIGAEAKSWMGLAWFWSKVLKNDSQSLENLEFWHEGSCCRCGRKLTDPESIERGIGPVCFKK